MANKSLTPEKKPICAVLDANVWVRHRLLNSSIGAAFLYRLEKINGRIGLPEVTEMEIISKVVKDGRNSVETIKNNLAVVRTLVGKTDEIELPSDDEFETATKARIAELSDILIRVGISSGHYESALKRVIQGTPPNVRSEEFRDSLVWEAVLVLSKAYDIALIT